MASLYTHQRANVQKTWALMAGFLVIVIAIGWLLGYYLGNPIILYIAVVLALVINVFAYWQSDKIAIKLSAAKPINIKDPEMRELDRIVENLSITLTHYGFGEKSLNIFGHSIARALQI